MANFDDVCVMLVTRLTNIEESILSVNNRLKNMEENLFTSNGYDKMVVSVKVKEKDYNVITFSNVKSRCRESDNLVVLTFAEEFDIAKVQNLLMRMQRQIYISSTNVLTFEYKIMFDYNIHWAHLGVIIANIIDKCELPLPETIKVGSNYT
jgi:hypothetical protein